MKKEKARAFLKWLFCDPLQFWILIILIMIHWSIIYFINLEPKDANHYFGPAFEIIGGLFVFEGINGKIKLFKHIDLKGIFLEWFKSCPCIKKHDTLKAEVGSIRLQGPSIRAYATLKRKCNTIDELHEELNRQIAETRKYVSETESVLLARITTVEDTLKGSIEENKQEIQEGKNLASEFAIGDYKWEILGALLIFYGVVISMFGS